MAVLLPAVTALADPPDADAPGSTGVANAPAAEQLPGRGTPGIGSVPASLPSTIQADRPDLTLLNWYGLRPFLADHGLNVRSSLTADWSKSLRGGGDTADDVFRSLFDLRLTYDLAKGVGWTGGAVSVDFQNESGRNGSDLIGDAQIFDNIDADGRTQISELWYEQTFGDTLRVKVGKVDVNTEFASPEYASQFLNSSFGHSPTITGLPTYPDPALSLNVLWTPVEWCYAGYGVYDGQDRGDHPPTFPFRGRADLFHIGEIGLRWTFDGGALPGRVAAGVSYENGRFDRFRGGEQNGTESLYAIAEQKLYHAPGATADDVRGVFAFAQFGTADEEVNPFRQHVSAGVTWVGPYPSERPDTVGLAFTSVWFSDARGNGFTEDGETSVELFYNVQPLSYLSVKPDLQYIVHPGGDERLRDALVATLRVTIAL